MKTLFLLALTLIASASTQAQAAALLTCIGTVDMTDPNVADYDRAETASDVAVYIQGKKAIVFNDKNMEAFKAGADVLSLKPFTGEFMDAHLSEADPVKYRFFYIKDSVTGKQAEFGDCFRYRLGEDNSSSPEFPILNAYLKAVGE